MSDGQTACNGGKLIDLLREQCELYEQLKKLSGRQRATIAGDKPELLLQILKERQAGVARLTRLNQELAPLRRDWNATMDALPADTRAEVSSLLERINTLLGGIIETDRQDSSLLSARKQMVANELSGLSGGRLANRGYMQSVPADRGGSADITG